MILITKGLPEAMAGAEPYLSLRELLILMAGSSDSIISIQRIQKQYASLFTGLIVGFQF